MMTRELTDWCRLSFFDDWSMPSTRVTGRTQSGEFIIEGYVDLELTPDAYEPARSAHLFVRGELDDQGEQAWAHVVAPSSSDDVEALYVYPSDGPHSAVVARDPRPTAQSKPGYGMNCRASHFKLPLIADLAPSDELWRTYGIATGQTASYVTVKNIGTTAVVASNIRVQIDGVSYQGQLWNAENPDSGTLQPGSLGSIGVAMAANTLKHCASYEVVIDLDNSAQTTLFDEMANDIGSLQTPCLTWMTTIDSYTFSDSQDGDLAIVGGKTLEQIISNQVSGRADGQLCNDCHNETSDRLYVPPSGLISPTTNIGHWSWADRDGWMDMFFEARPKGEPKPGHLRRLFQQWRNDGAR